MTVVLKLGGSVVTEKDEPETLAAERLSGLARSIAGIEESLVLVHGGGSFGHHNAAKHDVSVTNGTTDAAAIRAIHDAMVRLNDAIVDALAAEGVPALPNHPLSIGARDDAGRLSLPTTAIEAQLEEGFVPVLHGDVVAHEDTGATVLSGDELVVVLARAVDADRVGLCSSVPGVLDGDGAVVERIDALDAVADALGESDATDVSGGMAGKVDALLDLAVPAAVFGPGSIDHFVEGGMPGTTIERR